MFREAELAVDPKMECAIAETPELEVPHPELAYLFDPIMQSIQKDFTWHFNGVEFYYGPQALDNHRPTNPIVELDRSRDFNKLFQLDFKNGEHSSTKWSSDLILSSDDFNRYGSSANNSSQEDALSMYLKRVNSAINLRYSDVAFENSDQIIWIKRMVSAIASCDKRGILNNPKGKKITDLFRLLDFNVYEED